MTRVVQSVGIALTVAYGAFILWVYATQPRTIGELRTAAAVQANVYTIDQVQFEEAMRNFRAGQYAIAIDHLRRADPAAQDPSVQFLIAYSHYALGRGRFADDDEQFKRALAAVDRAIEVAPNNTFTLEDPTLRLEYTSASRLRQRIREGLEVTPGDFNPFRREEAP